MPITALNRETRLRIRSIAYPLSANQKFLSLARWQSADTTSRTNLHLKTISDGTLGESADE